VTKQPTRTRKSKQKGEEKTDKRKLPFLERIMVDLLEMPRVARWFVVAFFSLVVTFAVRPFIDTLYVRNFFDEGTVIAPALVAMGFGLLMYIMGYWLIVGWQGQQLSPRRAVLVYIGIGMLAFLIVIIWFLVLLI
jgi:hypothetical protein